MENKKLEIYFLAFLILGVATLFFFVFTPFLYSLVMAVVFFNVFSPLHQKILSFFRNQEGTSAFLSTMLVFLIVITPLFFIFFQIFKEASELYFFLIQKGGAERFSENLGQHTLNFLKTLPYSEKIFLDINSFLKEGLASLLSGLGSIFADVAKKTLSLIISLFVFLVTLYYLFKDGSKLKKFILRLSPLHDIHDNTIFDKLSLAINSVIKGSLVVALAQGFLTALGFFIFGVPNFVLWGSVASVAALIPGVGTSLVILPAVVFLYFKGGLFLSLGLFLWGILAVGLIDNFLGPKLVGRGTRLHPLLVLFSVLGGVAFFGPLGFLLGPLVTSLLFALLDVYFSLRNDIKT